MITLWALMIINNWYLIVDLCCAVKGYDNTYRLYFVLFYYFSAIIGMNLFIALVMDMYVSVERLEDEKMAVIEMIKDEVEEEL